MNSCHQTHLRLWLVVALLPSAFTAAAAAQATISGTANLTNDSGQYLRTERDSCTASTEAVRYTTAEFYVTTAGTYTFRTSGNTNVLGHVGDPLVTLYVAPFDPELPTANCLAANDDSMGLEASLSETLAVGNVYTAVISTYSAGATGLVGWSASGTGDTFRLNSVTKLEVIDAAISGGTLVVQLSDPDTARFVLVAGGAPRPNRMQVLAGRDASGQTAIAAGSVIVSDAQAGATAVLSELSASSDYDIYVVANNGGFGSGVRRTRLHTDTPPPPSLVSSLPADGAGNVAVGSSIVLTFDQSLHFDTGEIRIVNQTDGTSEAIDVSEPAERLVLSSGDSVLTITPEAELVPGRTYHVEIDATALVGTHGAYAGISAASTLNFSMVPADTTPEPFTFIPQTGVAPGSELRSNAIIVRAINVPTEITITDGMYSINGAPATDEPGLVNADDEVELVVLASLEPATTTTTSLTIGTESGVFEVTTGDATPWVVAEDFSGENDHCLQGGVQLSIGVDYDGDEALSEDELRQTSYICNGRSAEVTSSALPPDPAVCPNGGVEIAISVPANEISSEPPSIVHADLCHGSLSLVRTAPIERGDDACPNGGVRVETWLDLDGSGEPGPDESSAVHAVCNGLQTLVDTTALATDAPDCANGGLRVRTGIDADGDGLLDTDEATSQSLLCNGRDTLIETTPLAPDLDKCPGGGLELTVGFDADGDGSLQPEERSKQQVLCIPRGTVSRTLRLEVGSAECGNGGLKVESGPDVNGDGLLDDIEVSSSELLCNGTGLAVRSIRLGPGEEGCAGGGTLLQSGVDLDGDGMLADGEVQHTDPVCAPAQLLVETQAFARSEDCASGGVRVISGHDDGEPSGMPGDGELQPEEIELERAVCLSADGSGQPTCSVTGGPGPQRASWAWLLFTSLIGLYWRRR